MKLKQINQKRVAKQEKVIIENSTNKEESKSNGDNLIQNSNSQADYKKSQSKIVILYQKRVQITK